MKNDTVFVLGAGFSNAIGACRIENKEFISPCDKDFFYTLEHNKLLRDQLSDKPCLTHMLDWMKIYDKSTNSLKQINFSMEKFWTTINLMLKLNSSINGFPKFGISDAMKENSGKEDIEFIANIDEWQKEMSQDEKCLYTYLSDTSVGNFFNPDGLILYLADYELKKLIFEVYSDSNYQQKTDTVNKFKELAGSAPVISFNYDCLAESILPNHYLFNYDQRLELMDKDNLIIKPHGSLAWIITKKYHKKEGTIEILKRNIDKKISISTFSVSIASKDELDTVSPIIIPMSPGKENFVASIDSGRIKICNDNKLNKDREFIDCVVAYAKLFELVRHAKRIVFIGYSFPLTDYETVTLFKIALHHLPKTELHICIKDNNFSIGNILCNKITYYRNGLEQFVKKFR